MNYVQQLKLGSSILGTGFVALYMFKSCIYFGKLIGLNALSNLCVVEPGQRACKFNKISGVGSTIYTEGYNLNIPWLERPIIYDVRTKPRVMQCVTGSAGKSTFPNHQSF